MHAYSQKHATSGTRFVGSVVVMRLVSLCLPSSEGVGNFWLNGGVGILARLIVFILRLGVLMLRREDFWRGWRSIIFLLGLWGSGMNCLIMGVGERRL